MPVLTKINTNVIADDAVTGDKFAGDAYLANTANQNISGTYSENRLYTSDAYTLSGNATVNSHLTLSSVKPTADVVLTAGGAYTITGTGVLSAGSLLAKERSDLTGMTGELGSVVTGTPALNLNNTTTFPVGHIIQVHVASPAFADTDFEVANATKTDADGLGVTISNLTAGNKLLVHISGGYSRSYGASSAAGAFDHLIVASPNTGSDAVIGGGKDYHRAGAEAGSNYKHFHVNVSGVYTIPSGVTSVEILRRVISHAGSLNVSWNSTAATVPITCSIMEIQQ